MSPGLVLAAVEVLARGVRDPRRPRQRPHEPPAGLVQRIERDLSVAPAPDRLLGGNGSLMRDGARELGWRGHAMRRNVADCQGSSRVAMAMLLAERLLEVRPCAT